MLYLGKLRRISTILVKMMNVPILTDNSSVVWCAASGICVAGGRFYRGNFILARACIDGRLANAFTAHCRNRRLCGLSHDTKYLGKRNTKLCLM